MKSSVLAASVAAIGLAAAVTACGGGPASTPPPAKSPTTQASTASTSPPPAAPAGYQRIGGPAQGISVAVPGSWVTVNFAQQTLRAAIRKIGLHGVSQATLAQDLQALQRLHAVYAVDIRSTVSAPGHFATNINAYCTTSGVTDSGRAGVRILRQSAATELGQLGAQNLRQANIDIGGVPGVQTSYTLSTSGAGTLQASQLEVLPSSDRACFVTLTAAGSLPGGLLASIAPSVRYP